MILRQYRPEESAFIARFFASVFSDSEGQSEGELIGELAKSLFETTDASDLFNYVAEEQGQIVGSIYFSRLFFQDDVDAFILGPVAVRTDSQGNGIGQALISHGLSDLKNRGVVFVLTYGDPRFYQRVGFRPISHTRIVAPFELSQPVGWLGQSLCEEPIESVSGDVTCVQALSDPVYW